MKKTFSIVVLLGLVLILLTGCAKGMDGSWNCVEAQITASNAELSAYRTLEQNGAIGTFCQVEIKEGALVKYVEDVTTYTVNESRQNGNVITARVSDRYWTYNVELRLSDDGKQIFVKRGENSYTLERSDFFNGFVLGFFRNIPIWVYILVGVAVVGYIALRIYAKSGSSKPKTGNPGNPGNPDYPGNSGNPGNPGNP